MPDTVVRKRWQKNRTTKLRSDVRDEDFAEVADNFQPPTEDEKVLIYDEREPMDIWVKQHFSCV